MSVLPQYVRRLPYVFYALAAFFFVYLIVTDWEGVETTQEFGQTHADGFDMLAFIMKSRVFYTGISEAAYLVANGAIIHVLIAIFDQLGGSKEAAE